MLLFCFTRPLFWSMTVVCVVFFFFQAEDGIRDRTVTGVQTCALPIYADRVLPASTFASRRLPAILHPARMALVRPGLDPPHISGRLPRGQAGEGRPPQKIGRASGRGRRWLCVGALDLTAYTSTSLP